MQMMITGAEDSEPDVDTDETDNESDDDTLDESIVPDDIRASTNAVKSLNLVDQVGFSHFTLLKTIHLSC